MSLQATCDSVHALYGRLMRSGSGEPFSVGDGRSADDGRTIFFLGTRCDGGPAAAPQTSVYRQGAERRPVPLHPGPARLLELSPDGERIAFVHASRGAPDRVLVMTAQGEPVADRAAPGAIEQLGWSPDGRSLLLLVAGPGTDTTTLAGSVGTAPGATPDDAPLVDSGAADPGNWRRLWTLRVGAALLEAVPTPDGMVWEAAWCGNDQLAVLHSRHVGEAAWYRAELGSIDLASGDYRTLHQPRDQLGHLAGSPDGTSVAFVEGVASDRGLVCGALKLVRRSGSLARVLDTGATEITSVSWRDTGILQVAGLHGLQTVVGDVDLASSEFREAWRCEELGCGAYLPQSRPAGGGSTIVAVEGYDEAPAIALLRGGAPEIVFSTGDASPAVTADCTAVRWTAPDGLEIEGLLIRPLDAKGPTPLVVDIHGGPIWAYRARWQARQRAVPALIAAGFSVLCPNPRGSCGRGQDFARRVLGDMGGADCDDILAGIDHLVAACLADAARIGLTGSSYGGFISALLPKRREAIAAAVPISPVSNWFSQHGTSNMPILEELFIGGSPGSHGAQYLARSPALSGQRTRAATLILAGALDRCTPLGQAVELHRALLEGGSPSVLVTYPAEGHSLRSSKGYLDSAARTVDWFVRHFEAR